MPTATVVALLPRAPGARAPSHLPFARGHDHRPNGCFFITWRSLAGSDTRNNLGTYTPTCLCTCPRRVQSSLA
jgi:hypothetical protein